MALKLKKPPDKRKASMVDELVKLVMERETDEPIDDGSLPLNDILPLAWLQQNTGKAFHVLDSEIEAEYYDEYWDSGGRGSLKSSYIGLKIVHRIMNDGAKGIQSNALVIRKVANTLLDSVYAQIVWAIFQLGAGRYWQFRKSPMEIVYRPTGQAIMFRGLDDPGKIRSIKPRKGHFGYLWFEEASELRDIREMEDVKISAIRGKGKAITFLSYNPPQAASSWINAAAIEPRTRRRLHKSTYLDAPPEWLGENFLREAAALRKRNEKKYRHTYLGEVVGSDGQVFSNVTLRQLSKSETAEYDHIRQGIDFGYTIDPFVWLRMHYDKKHRTLIIYDEIYKVGLSNRAAAELIRKRGLHWQETVADSSEPKSIAEMRDYGLRIRSAKKGPDSIRYGIGWLQDLDAIIIDPVKCPNAAREFRAYELEPDRHGGFKASFPDENNHTIDAVRYACEDDMQKGGGKFINLRTR